MKCKEVKCVWNVRIKGFNLLKRFKNIIGEEYSEDEEDAGNAEENDVSENSEEYGPELDSKKIETKKQQDKRLITV